MEFKTLFESLDEKVFTPELQESLEASFNEAVETKALELASTKIEENAEAVIAEAKEKEDKILESVDNYLERVVEEFITESKEKLDQILVSERADTMVEAFDAMILSGAVDIAELSEGLNTDSADAKLAESVEKYDNLVEENIKLTKSNDELIKAGVIAEMQADLTVVEAAKFEKLADLVEFSKTEEYGQKLDTIKESVKGEVKVEVNENLNENLNEAKSVYSHLV